MNTHSYKVNEYEPFKTHQEQFLETFQIKIQQNTYGKGGAEPSSRGLCYSTHADILQNLTGVKSQIASPGLCK